MRKEIRALVALVVVLLLADLPQFALAAEPLEGGGAGATGKLKNPLGATSTLPALLDKLLSLMIQLGIPIIVLAYVYAGFKYVTAFGDAKKAGEATEAFKWTTVGAGVLLGAKAITMIIKGTVEQLGLK